jgi:hypothetical protein
MRPLLLLPLLLPACVSPPHDARESVEPAPGATEALGGRSMQAPAAGSTGAQTPQVREVTPAPWPEDFKGSVMLLADRIRVEGPPGLLDHCVTRSDDGVFLRTVKATSEGLLQVVQPGPGAAGEIVRGQLDGWALAATRELVLLERPTSDTVRVIAEGQVVWATPDGERSEWPRKEFTAAVPRP